MRIWIMWYQNQHLAENKATMTSNYECQGLKLAMATMWEWSYDSVSNILMTSKHVCKREPYTNKLPQQGTELWTNKCF